MKKTTKHYLFSVVLLAAFWLALSGHFTPLLLGLGVLSVGLVIFLQVRMDRADDEAQFLRPNLHLISYGAWLLLQVVRSNLDVAKRIWDPTLPVRPAWLRLETQVTSRMERTLYANSITLTPGTLTTDVREDHFLVHTLSETGLDELKNGDMERRVRSLEI